MGRHKSPPAEVVDVTPLNERALAKAGAAATELGVRSAEIVERFGDGLPYDRERVVGEAVWYGGIGAQATLEFGKRLIQLKEHEPHGEFIEICEQRLGIGKRAAQIMMQAAHRYLSPRLAPKAQTFALLGKSKLFDLMAESDEDLEELAEGGTLAGKTLDQLAGMSVREMRAALAAKDKVIAKKEAKVSELEERLARREAPAEAHDAALEEMQRLGFGAQTTARALVAAANELMNHELESVQMHARQTLEWFCQSLAEMLAEAQLEVDVLGQRVTPAWLEEIKAIAAEDHVRREEAARERLAARRAAKPAKGDKRDK